MARQPTLFMQIHKTAGEAMAKQVIARLPAESVCPMAFEWEVRRLPLTELRGFSFFQGHISPSALTGACPDLRVFTMMRAPKERLLSCYYYWKEGSKHARTEFFDTIGSMSRGILRCRRPIIRRATWNVQARLIAGGQFGGVDQQRQNVFGPWLTEPELVSEAVRALDRFAFVGTVEQYGLSLRAVYGLLILGEPPPPERFNITLARTDSYDVLLADPDIDDAVTRLTRPIRLSMTRFAKGWSVGARYWEGETETASESRL